jgi:hypothetical protein
MVLSRVVVVVSHDVVILDVALALPAAAALPLPDAAPESTRRERMTAVTETVTTIVNDATPATDPAAPILGILPLPLTTSSSQSQTKTQMQRQQRRP